MKLLATATAVVLLTGCAAAPPPPAKAAAATTTAAKPPCARSFDGTGSHISDRASCLNGSGDVRNVSAESFANSQRQANPMTVPGGH